MKYNALDWLAFTLVIVGALNWGLVGAFDYNLVTEIFGTNSTLSDIVFVAVGLAGVYTAYALAKPGMYRDRGAAHY